MCHKKQTGEEIDRKLPLLPHKIISNGNCRFTSEIVFFKYLRYEMSCLWDTDRRRGRLEKLVEETERGAAQKERRKNGKIDPAASIC